MFFFLMVIELAPKTGGKIFILYKTHCRCLLESWHGSVDHTCKPQRLCAVLSCRVAHKTSPLFTESYCIIFYLHNNNAQGPQTGPGSCLPLGVTHLQRQPLSKDFAIEIAEKTNSGRKTGVIGWLRPEGEDQRSWGWGSGRRGWFGIIFGQGSWWKWTGGKLKGSLVFSYFYHIWGMVHQRSFTSENWGNYRNVAITMWANLAETCAEWIFGCGQQSCIRIKLFSAQLLPWLRSENKHSGSIYLPTSWNSYIHCSCCFRNAQLLLMGIPISLA